MSIEKLDQIFKDWKNKARKIKRKKANSDIKEELEYLRRKRIEREMRGNKPVGYHAHKSDDFCDIH